MINRTNIIIGDLHGCREEFNLLLDKIDYHPNKHRLILVGDILDRGPDPVGLLQQVRQMGIESVFSNHEEKAFRWRTYEGLKELTGRNNPIRINSEERRQQWLSLSKEELQWISELPTSINIKDNWYVLHAGVEPGRPIAEQDLASLVRLRYVDEAGNFRKLDRKNKNQPAGTYFWAERWDQPQNIIFGHQRHEEPKQYINKNNVCVGLDTGCVFGGSLTAFLLEENTFVQVAAKQNYCK